MNKNMENIKLFEEFDFDDLDLKDLEKDMASLGFEKFKAIIVSTITRTGKCQWELISGRDQKEMNAVFRLAYGGGSNFKGSYDKNIIGIGSHLEKIKKEGEYIYWDIIDGLEMKPEFKKPIYKLMDAVSPYYCIDVLKHYTTNGESIFENLFVANNRRTDYHQELRGDDFVTII